MQSQIRATGERIRRGYRKYLQIYCFSIKLTINLHDSFGLDSLKTEKKRGGRLLQAGPRDIGD